MAINKLYLTLIITLMMVSLVGAVTEYTPSTTKTCVNGKCNLMIYSSIENVYEDGRWIKPQEARSLMGKGFEVKYLETDKDISLDIVDFNLTSITLKVQNKLGTAVPMKVWIPNNTKLEETKTGNYKKDMIKTTDTSIASKDLSKEMKVSFGVDKVLEFGANSTTIILQTANSQNLDDSYLDTANPDTILGNQFTLNFELRSISASDQADGIIKFNISSIPKTATIINANLELNLNANTLDADIEGHNITTYRVYQNFSWNEEAITWNTRPLYANISPTQSDTKKLYGGDAEPSGWQYWNVTSIINADFVGGYNTTTIYLDANNTFGTPGATDIVRFAMKEYTTNTSERPILRITYEEGGADTTAPTLTIVYPSNGSKFNTNVTWANYTIYDANSTQACWWNLDNGANTTLASCGTNITGVQWGEGWHNLTIYGNDSTGNVGNKTSTFLVDLTLPNGTLISPANGTTTSQTTNNFTANVSDNFGFGNATLKIYNIATGLINSTVVTLTDIVTGSVGVVVTLVDGIYNWFYQLFDIGGNSYTTENNTLGIDTTAPVVSLTSPADGVQVTGASQTFVSSFSDTTGLTNATLYIWYANNSLAYTNFETLTETSDGSSFPYSLTMYEIYKWNYKACDTLHNCRFANANRTIEYLETINPIGNKTGCLKIFNQSGGNEVFELCRDGYFYTWSPSGTKWKCGVTDGGSWTCTNSE